MRWIRWHGAPADLVDAVRAAAEVIEKWGGKAPPYEVEWRIGDTTVKDVALEDLANIADYDLPKLESISLHVGSYSGPQCSLSVHRWRPAITGTVRGSSNAEVDGLASELARHLDRGERWPASLWWLDIVTVAGGITAALFIEFAVLLVLAHVSRPTERLLVDSWWVAAIPFAIVAGLMPLAFGLVVPTLEMHPRGAPTRFQRFRGAIVGAVVVVALGVISGLIAPLFIKGK